MTRAAVDFDSEGVRCGAWHYPTSGRSAGCVVMAHGFGATVDCGLEGFARGLSEAGFPVLAFDYRGFGRSDGDPRQVVDINAQLQDYRAAIRAARGLPGVDPARIVVWGVSLAGGHVFRLAAEDGSLAAAISLTPAVDGAAAMWKILRRDGVRPALGPSGAALRDALSARLGRGPVVVPLAGAPGTGAAVSAPGALQQYCAIAGPSWRNEVAARVLLQIPRYRPGRLAAEVGCPLLVQIADYDQTAPPEAAMTAARRVQRAEVRHYPADHFDIYPGAEWHDHVLGHQIDFLARHLPGSRPASAR